MNSRFNLNTFLLLLILVAIVVVGVGGYMLVGTVQRLAHPLEDQPAVLLHRSIGETAAGLDAGADAYIRLVGRAADDWHMLVDGALGPLVRIPRHPVAMARFGMTGIRSATGIARRFGARGRALIAGLSAHSIARPGRPSLWRRVLRRGRKG